MPSGCCDYHGMFTIAHPYQKFHLAGCWIPVAIGVSLRNKEARFQLALVVELNNLTIIVHNIDVTFLPFRCSGNSNVTGCWRKNELLEKGHTETLRGYMRVMMTLGRR